MLARDADCRRFVVPVTGDQLGQAPRHEPDGKPERDDVFHCDLDTGCRQPCPP
jgi:hypothetical protein